MDRREKWGPRARTLKISEDLVGKLAGEIGNRGPQGNVGGQERGFSGTNGRGVLGTKRTSGDLKESQDLTAATKRNAKDQDKV